MPGLALAGVGVLVLAFCWRSGEAFEVNGVPFRIWVARHPDFDIRDPLAAVGTNAIPHFISLLREPSESSRLFQLKAWTWKRLPRLLQSRLRRWEPLPNRAIKRTALFGLRFLGPEAKAALPDLSRRDLAVYLQSARSPITAAAPLLLREAEKELEPVAVLEAFEFLGDASRPAVPHMIRVFHRRTYRGNMLTLWKRLGPLALEAVPTLAEALSEDEPCTAASVLQTLKAIGPEARAAIPAIQPLLTHNDPTELQGYRVTGLQSYKVTRLRGYEGWKG